MPSLHSHRFSRWMGTGAIGRNSSRKDVLACRQVAVVTLPLTKACRVLAIDGQHEAEAIAKFCAPVDEQTT